MQTPHFLAAMQPALTSTDLIDAHSKSLIASMDTLRDHAAFLRDRANDADAKADVIRAELGDWNRVRAAALQGQQVATAADRVLESGGGTGL